MAVLGSTVLGTLGSGLAFFAAPGILGGAGIGMITALAKVRLRFFAALLHRLTCKKGVESELTTIVWLETSW